MHEYPSSFLSFPLSRPLSSSFSLANQWRRPPVSLLCPIQTWLLHFAGLQLTSTRQTRAQHGSILAQVRTYTHRTVSIQSLVCVRQRAGSWLGNRLFLCCFAMSQRPGLQPNVWQQVKSSCYTEQNMVGEFNRIHWVSKKKYKNYNPTNDTNYAFMYMPTEGIRLRSGSMQPSSADMRQSII